MSTIQQHKVKGELPFVNWWSFGRILLLLYLLTHQPCDKSSNIEYLLDVLELEHEAAEHGPLPPQMYWEKGAAPPQGLELRSSPAPEVGSGKTDLWREMTVGYCLMELQEMHSEPPLHKTTQTLPSGCNDRGVPRVTDPGPGQ